MSQALEIEMCKTAERVLREHRSPFDDGTVPTLTFPGDAKALAAAVVRELVLDGWKIEKRKGR